MSDPNVPIAIVGMQGRFPGDAPTPGAFWAQLLAADCFADAVPADRWSNRRFATKDLAAGKTPVSRGYFLNYPYQTFDPDMFGFAPDEIANMDPQQRLILEVAWEALELAGIDPGHLAGTPAGVYVGGFTSDHLLNQFSSQARVSLGRYSASGATLTMLSNRLSYALDLRGPSVTVDTACASSLSALSLAVRDLQAGLCPVALVGGVNFMLRPEYPIGMSVAKLLAIDGRSKPFSALADGYGRGEGCGVIVLKRLEDARRDGDPVLAVVAAAATGHDGRTAGISLPNGCAQRDLMRQALDMARLAPGAIGYVEAHGTGTAQGDPVEAHSISAVYGKDRAGPLPIGSLKANIGHLEAAAGMAGLIKAVLMLQARQIPPHLLVGRPNPAIAFDALNLRLPRAPEPLRGQHVAVNAFGYGGSTAHVILSHPQDETQRPRAPHPAPTGNPLLLPLSAHSQAALSAWVPQLAERVAAGMDVTDLAATLAHRRHAGTFRAALWLDPSDDAATQAAAIAAAPQAPDIARGLAAQDRPPRTLFVCAGMGPQWAGMGRSLWHGSEVFRTALQEVDAAFQALARISVIDAITDPDADVQMQRCRVAQPANFAMQVGVIRVLADHGLHPDLCLGHSAGEVAAAWAAGHLDLEQAVAVCWARSELQDGAAGQGGMLAVHMDEAAAQALCADWPGLELAAVNGPDSVTLAGPNAVLDAAASALRRQGQVALRLNGDIAYHSAAMDGVLGPLKARLAHIEPHPPTIPLLSSVTGGALVTPGMDAAYWGRNVRAPVRFQDALAHAFDRGATHCIELAARPVLQKAIRQTAQAAFRRVSVVGTANQNDDHQTAIRAAVALHHVAGGALDWDHLAPRSACVELPPTAWQRQHFWHEPSVQARDRLGHEGGTVMAEPGTTPRTWIADLNTQALAFLTDHRVDGVAILPGAASIEAALQAVRAQDHPAALRNIALEAPFTLDRKRGQVLDTRCARQSIETLAYDPSEPENARRVLSADTYPDAVTPDPVQITALAAAAPHALDINTLRKRLSALGLGHAEAFQTVTRLSLAPDGASALAQVSVPAPLWQEGAFVLHPCLLDGVFQAGLALTTGNQALVPVRVGACHVVKPLPARIWAWITMTAQTPGPDVTFDATLYDDAGAVLAHLEQIHVTPIRPQAEPVPLPELCLQQDWHAAPAPEGGTAAPDTTVHLAFGAEGDVCAKLAHLLEKARAPGAGRLYVVTDRAFAIAPGDGAVSPAQTAIWGLGRTLYNEIAATGTTLIDVDQRGAWQDHVAREVAMNSPSSEVAWRDGERFLPRLTQTPLTTRAPVFRGDASYLITGGLGGLGRSLAIWAARHGAGRLVLSTRTPPGRAAILPLERTLRKLGATLAVVPLDLTDAAAVRAMIRDIDGPDHGLAGIFHWAGQTRDMLARDLSDADLRAVCEPKVPGADHLHAASLTCHLDHFVMASSLSALVGNQRQANYAAANAYLDGLAWARRHAGLPALSVNFGAVSGAGMAADPRVAAHLRAAGLPAMTAATALAGLGAAMAGGMTQISLAQGINLPRWVRYDARCAATDKMAGIVGDAGQVTTAQGDIAAALAGTAPQGRPALLAAHLQTRLATVMSCPPERLIADRALARQGMDSLAAVEFQIVIEQDLGISVPIVSLIGGQSLAEVAARLATEWTEAHG